MSIVHIHTYLVRPGKSSSEDLEIGGTTVEAKGKLYDLLERIYERSDQECDVEIAFLPDAATKQENSFREDLVKHIQFPSLDNGRVIARRLEKVTTHRSGLGLLFLICGIVDGKSKIVISRFPADSGILAEEGGSKLSIEFLERVFMKSAKSYKAAMFVDDSFLAGFWKGRAVDKQINDSEVQLSQYWIGDFLTADFLRTSAAGTRTLAVALRESARSATDVDVKHELVSAAILARGFAGETISINEISERLKLSEEARVALGNAVPRSSMLSDKFKFDLVQFTNQISYRMIILDNDVIITAPLHKFNDVIKTRDSEEKDGKKEFTTVGHILDERLRKTQ